MGTAPLRTKEKPLIRKPDQGFLLVAGVRNHRDFLLLDGLTCFSRFIDHSSALLTARTARAPNVPWTRVPEVCKR
jgi:hypothetical protein